MTGAYILKSASLAIVLCLILSIAGCAKSYKGEAFETSRGKKIGGAEIYIMNNQEIFSLIAAAEQEHKERLDQVSGKLKSIDWVNLFDSKFNVIEGARKYPPLPKDQQKKLAKEYSEKWTPFFFTDWERIDLELKELHPSKYYAKKVIELAKGNHAAKTLTNSDGSFNIQARNGKVLVAISPDGWYVWIHDLNKTDATLQLTELNTVENDCKSCLVNFPMPQFKKLSQVVYAAKDHGPNSDMVSVIVIMKNAREANLYAEKK